MTEITQNLIRYPRPTRLSDPGCDFTPEECAAILAVPDDRLGWPELGNIFQGFLPAGTYEECAYFIPHAVRFIDERGDCASDLAKNFLDWAGEQRVELEADGLFAPIRAHMQELLRACLSEFRIRFGTRPGRNVPSPADASLVESLVLGLNGTPRGYGTCPFGKAATPVVLDAVGGLRDAAAAAWFAEFSSPQFLMGDELDAPLYEMLSDASNIARAKALLQDVILRDSPLADYCRKESLVSKLWE